MEEENPVKDNRQALGIIETVGRASLIEAVDSAIKGASVSFKASYFVGGGLNAVTLVGDVGAMRAALDAAQATITRLNACGTTHLIARLASEVWPFIQDSVEPPIFHSNKLKTTSVSANNSKSLSNKAQAETDKQTIIVNKPQPLVISDEKKAVLADNNAKKKDDKPTFSDKKSQISIPIKKEVEPMEKKKDNSTLPQSTNFHKKNRKHGRRFNKK
jgi:microcompartment protein CcmL/EutN